MLANIYLKNIENFSIERIQILNNMKKNIKNFPKK